MKLSFLLTIIFLFLTTAFGQEKNNLQKIYEAEKSFEQTIAEQNINRAFLAFLAPDGVIFHPQRINGREFWKTQADSTADLRWNPNYVDVSSNGAVGWTTGNSIYRAKGKADPNAYYGEYLSIWERQPDNRYLIVLDCGISHDKPNTIETAWKSPADSGKEANANNSSAADSTIRFYQTASQNSLEKAYKIFAAEDIHLLREGKMPIIGKSAAASEAKNMKGVIVFPKRSVFNGAADLAYITNTYTLTKPDKTVEKGNFVQIWKLRGGKWLIVADFFKPVADK